MQVMFIFSYDFGVKYDPDVSWQALLDSPMCKCASSVYRLYENRGLGF